MTALVDLTPIVVGTGQACLLDMVASRAKAALKDWLTARDPAFRGRIKVVTMDRFSGCRTATAETLDKAPAVMNPFHGVRWPQTNSPCVVNACNRICADIGAAEGSRSTESAAPC